MEKIYDNFVFDVVEFEVGSRMVEKQKTVRKVAEKLYYL
jgi:hypothetical protein